MKICYFYWDGTKRGGNIAYLEGIQNFHFDVLFALNWLWHGFQLAFQYQLELWVTSLSDTPRLQYYDVHTLEYRYISKLPMKNERIWSYVEETTSHLQNKQVELSPLVNFRQQRYSFMQICRLCTTTVKFHKNSISRLVGVVLTR